MSVYKKLGGVDIEGGNRVVADIRDAVTATYDSTSSTQAVEFGLFAGTCDLHPDVQLLLSTDGVGTKADTARRLGTYVTIGQDLVHHCINDILVQGSLAPRFFLDYIGCNSLADINVAEIVKHMAETCKDFGIQLVGGETAEMKRVYKAKSFEVVGTIGGLVTHPTFLCPKQNLREGDVVLGLESWGLHTNGYSLVNELLCSLGWNYTNIVLENEETVGDVLVKGHRPYLQETRRLLDAGVNIHAMVHVTGGGLVDNPARVVPDHLQIEIDTSSWTPPPIYSTLQHWGNVSHEEMYQVFNMGIGFLFITDSANADLVHQLFAHEKVHVVGKVKTRAHDSDPACILL